MTRPVILAAYRRAVDTLRLEWRRVVPVFLLLAVLKLAASMAKTHVLSPGPGTDVAAGFVKLFGVMSLHLFLDSLFMAVAIATAWWAVTHRRPTIVPVLKLGVAVLCWQLAAAIGGQVLGGLLATAVLPPQSFGQPADPLWRGIPFATTIVLVGLMELHYVRWYSWYGARERPLGAFGARAWLLSALVMTPVWIWNQLARAAPDGVAITVLQTIAHGAVVHPLFALALVHAYCLRWPQPEAVPEAA